MTATPGADLLAAVEAALVSGYGAHSGRGSVSFVGAERIDVLRFGPDGAGLVRYATVGMARRPMADPAAPFVDPVAGPRAELVLTLRGGQDTVLRTLAVLASTPVVEGLVLGPDATVDTREPLWPGAPFTAVLLEPTALPEVIIRGIDPVRVLPVVPITQTELAYRRIHGAAALREAWAEAGTDLHAQLRRSTVGGTR
ncbi:suppressor of fused domain protein [soil metagenome]